MNAENGNAGPAKDYPDLAAIVRRLKGDRNGLPAAMRLPHRIFTTDGSVWPGQDAGFLGRGADPWLFTCEPGSPTFRISEFSLPVDVPPARLEGRQSLLREVNQ